MTARVTTPPVAGAPRSAAGSDPRPGPDLVVVLAGVPTGRWSDAERAIAAQAPTTRVVIVPRWLPHAWRNAAGSGRGPSYDLDPLSALGRAAVGALPNAQVDVVLTSPDQLDAAVAPVGRGVVVSVADVRGSTARVRAATLRWRFAEELAPHGVRS